MKKYASSQILAAMAVTLLIASCKVAPQDPPSATKHSLTHDGIEREYLYYEPVNLTVNAPLVLVLHGFTSSAERIMEYSAFNQLADEFGFAVAYPQGTTDEKGNTFWNVGYDFHADVEVDDLDFIATLVRTLQKEKSLSPINTFATGMSNGGEMCYLLACSHADLFNAVAPVAGTMMNNRFETCRPSRSIPIFSIFGTDDQTTNYHGDEQNQDGWGPYKSTPAIIEFWTTQIGYASVALRELPDTVSVDSSHVMSTTYANDRSTLEYVHYEVVGCGHDWPGAWGNKDIHASTEIWHFFQRHLKEE